MPLLNVGSSVALGERRYRVAGISKALDCHGSLQVGALVVVGAKRYRVESIRVEKAFNPNQARDPDGKWTSTGGASPARAFGADVNPWTVPGAAHAGSIPEYLKMVSKIHDGRPSVEGFILQHGRGYPTDKKSHIGGKPHMCYMNSFKKATETDLTYVEGYVSVHGVPIHHAWNVDQAGVVRDYTIGDKKGIMGYFGVPLRTDYVMDTAWRKKTYGVLVHENYQRIISTAPSKMVKK